ncbi:MAG: SRPBCC family protein [Agitococcus sp.]|nr:SRPBCC family protein [Agitococcus sp.]MDO9179380.1 SRPBCC family protein [Agitococcus sp.]
MPTISVTHLFNAPINEVFEAVINADKYPYVSRLIHVERIRPASAKEKDGVGTMREVELGVMWFKEEFVSFDRPKRVDYKILEARPYFEHQIGSFCFKKRGTMTEVTWSSTFRVPSVWQPRLVSKLSGWVAKAAFKSTLMVLDNKLQASRSLTRIK